MSCKNMYHRTIIFYFQCTKCMCVTLLCVVYSVVEIEDMSRCDYTGHF